MSNFETTVTLPTNGFFYENSDLKTITLRDITTKEEKMLLGSTGDDTMSNIVRACIVNPKNIDVNELIASDLHFLLMKLRIHTYGPEYKVTFQCPACGNSEISVVNLDDLIIYNLEEKFETPMVFELPKSGDTLGCRLLTQKDTKFINQLAKRATKQSPGNRQQAAYSIRQARHIMTINDKPVTDAEAQSYVQNMHGKDSAYFWWKINDVKIGYDTTIEHTCSACGNEFESTLPISSEFFRPTFG